MYKLMNKGLSWVLVLTLFLSSFPMGEGVVKAEGTTSSSSDNVEQTELDAPESETDYLPVEDITGDHMIVTEGKETGSYELTAFDDDIKVKTNEGQVLPIDSTLELKEDSFSPKATSLPVSFEKILSSDSPFLQVGDKDAEVMFTLKGITFKDGFLTPKDTATTVQGNQVWHHDVFPGVDIRHVTLSDEVKEDVILHDVSSLPQDIVYEFKTKLDPQLDNNQVSFFNDGQLVLTMPVPEMQDSAVDEKSGLPSRSLDIKYELVSTGEDTYELKVVPSQEWLQDASRVYPIYVDPTLARDATLDTFVSSKNPTSNMNKFWSSSRGEYVLWIGYFDATTGTNYGLIKFPALSDLRGAVISAAEMSTYVTWSYYATQKNGLWLDRVNANWSETGVTWNTRPSSTNLLSTNVARDQWANFDVTTFVSQIAAGNRTDYGFKLHTNGNTTTHWKQISASENNKNRTKLNVTYSYPKMASITTEGFLTTPSSSTGYININWPAMAGATGYRLQMYDGKGWQTIYSGASRAYTTKDKGIFPKTSQYGTKEVSTGGTKFRNGDGQDLLVDPSGFFNASSGTTTNTLSYQFRVIADYKLGSGSASSVAKRSLQELIPDVPTGLSLTMGDTTADDKAQFVLEWDESEHATSYDVYAFNGFAYELIDNVKETSWSPNGKRLFPTSQQINAMPINTRTAFRKGDGQDFPGDPRPLYQKNNPDRTTYHNVLHYYFRVYAKSSKGQSAGSTVRTMNVPAPRVTSEAVGYSDNRKNNTGFLFANWQPVPGAAGYNVYLYNGKEYDLVETLPSDVTSWHSRNKKLWPLDNQSYKLNIDGVVGKGGELPVDPSPNYRLSGGKYGDKTNYWIRVTAHRRALEENVLLASNFISEGNLLRTLPITPSIVAVDEPDLGTEEFYPMLDTSLGAFNVLKGNQFLEETDDVLPGRGPSVSADRYFNSQAVRLGMFGLGWHSGLERRLEIPQEANPRVVRYVDEDGSGHLFLRTLVKEGDQMVEKLLPPTGVDYEFLIDNVKKEYSIQSNDGEREIYNESGQLIAMEYDAKEAGKKNKVRFEYEEVNGTNRLKAVYAASDDGTTSPNRLVFTYNDKGWVSEMTASASSDEKLESRTYRYSYDAWDRLVKVESFKGESSIEVYEYEYAESVSTVEETGEVAVRPDFPSVINRLVLPGHATGSSNEILGDFDGLTPSVVTEVDGTRTAYKNISAEGSDDKVYQVKTVDNEENGVEESLIYTFSKYGHLTKEATANKTTSYTWEDHRITKVTNPDGSVESTDYDKRETADVDKTTELDGNVLVEQDATSITTYEYAKNGDDILRIEDEFGLAEEIALNEDREEIVSHEEPEERIGFSEYDSRGNVVREGVGLTPGVNLYPNGGFEASESVMPGSLVTGGRNGKALQLNNATFSREVNVKAGHPYNLGIDMKTTGTAKGSVTLTLLDNSNVTVGTYMIRPMGNLNEWTRRFVEFTAPAGAVKVRVATTSESGSTLFDEVQLDTAKQGHAVSASAFNHVEQGGFDGTNKWQLVKATANPTGYMSESGLSLQPNGTAKQTIFVNQSTAKPFYVSALAQKASKTDSLNVVATYEDGTTVQKTASFNTLNYTDGENASTWQRQTIQLTSESNKKLVKVDVTLQNGSNSNIIVDAVRASVGRVVSEVTYDKQGNHVLKEAGLSKLPVTNSVDAFGNVLTLSRGNRIWQNKYDLLGRLTGVIAENGTTIKYNYNQKGELTKKIFGEVVSEDNVVINLGSNTTYDYLNGRISSITRPNNQQYQYLYENQTGNLIETKLPSGKRISNVYDNEGNITEIKEDSITKFKYTFDRNSGRLAKVQRNDDSIKEKTYVFESSETGSRQLMSLTDYFGRTQKWNYYSTDETETELVLSTSLGDFNRTFTYDVANRNDSVLVKNASGKSFKWIFRHNENGKLIQVKMPNQSGETLLEYDENGNMTSWSALSNDKMIASEQYKYDSYGNIISLIKEDKTLNYAYDVMDQLVEEETFEGEFINYSYDKRGNRTKINDQVVANFNESNQMTEFKNQNISYDADGNRISDGEFEYSWDGFGKLVKIQTLNGSKKWEFKYDEHGRRIQKTSPNGTIYFHYEGDSNHLIAETDHSGKVIREYIYNADGLLVGLKIDNLLYNYQRNHRGDVIAITDSSGEIAAEYSYDVWGQSITEIVSDTKLIDQPIRYASYYFDKEIKLYYLLARYYHPEHGVFLSLDPLIDTQETIEMANGYSYAVNNPLKFIDSSGLAVRPDGFGSGSNAGLGGGSNFARAGVGGGSRPGNATAKNKNSQIKINQAKGKAFEDRMLRELGIKNKNTTKYYNAIPDAVRGNTFYEFKNAKYVSKTKQFRNYEKSVNRGVRLNLYVRHWTVVTKSVRDLVEKSGGKIYRR